MLNSFLLNQLVLNGCIPGGAAPVIPFSATQRQIDILGFASIMDIHGKSEYPDLLGNVKTTNIYGKAE
jgi:hypothetical protein